MHELSITQSIVAIVDEAAAGKRVLRVTLEVGKLAGVVTTAIDFCFDLVARGTACEGATLEIRELGARVRCRACGVEQETDTMFAECPCGVPGPELVAGMELRVKSIELAEDPDGPA